MTFQDPISGPSEAEEPADAEPSLTPPAEAPSRPATPPAEPAWRLATTPAEPAFRPASTPAEPAWRPATTPAEEPGDPAARDPEPVWRAADNMAPEREAFGDAPAYPYDTRTGATPDEPVGGSTVERQSFARWLLEMVVLVAVAFLLATGIKSYVVQPFIIPSLSMAPTLEINDRVLVNKFVYRFAGPERGDIVVFLEPGSKKTDYIKRVVAVAGETVDLREGVVYVDDVPLREPYVHGSPSEIGDIQMPVTIPEGYVFLMGDNRQNSRDSRWFGPQPVQRVLGKAFAIYWPPRRLRTF